MSLKLVFNPLSGQFDFVQDTSGFVPYTGATDNVDLGSKNLTAENLISQKKIAIGISSVQTQTIYGADNLNVDESFLLEKYGGNNKYAGISAGRTRGVTAGSQAVVFNSDRVGQFSFKASSGAVFGYSTVAGITSEITKQPIQQFGMDWYSLSAQMTFSVAEDNITTSPTAVMRLNDSGGLSIGKTYVGTDPGENNVIIQGKVGIATTTLTNALNITGGFSATLKSYIDSGLIVNEAGGGGADDDFRAETDTITDALLVDASADTVEINASFKTTKKHYAIPDAITATSEGVAASLNTLNTEVTTNGDRDEDNVTLADGVSGQIKHIYCVAVGDERDSWKITPANMVGGSKITFSSIAPAVCLGRGCTLVYADNEGWVIIGNNGGTIS